MIKKLKKFFRNLKINFRSKTKFEDFGRLNLTSKKNGK